MRVLVIDNDRHFADLVAKVLGAEGHEVDILVRADRAAEDIRRRRPDVVVADIDLVVSSGELLASNAPGSSPDVILTSARSADDIVVRSAISTFSARHFLSKPFSVLDLADTIGRLPPRSASGARPAAPARRSAPVKLPAEDAVSDVNTDSTVGVQGREALRNIALLARIWASRGSGRLALNVDGEEQGCVLAGGGPLDAAGMRLIERAMLAGELTFLAEPGARAPGAWRELGRLLFDRVRKPSRLGFANDNRFRALVRTRWSDGADALLLHPSTRLLVSMADGQVPLGSLMARASVDPADIGADLHCLRRLRLVDLQQPVASTDASTQTPHSGESAAVGLRSVTSAREWTSPDSVTSVNTASRSNPSSSRGGIPRSRRQQVSDRLQGAASNAHGDPNVVQYRLEKEVERLGNAPPAVVLGVPAHASPQLLEQAARRMRERYSAMAGDPAMSPKARQLAADMGRLAEAAWRRMSNVTVHAHSTRSGGSSSGSPSIPRGVLDLSVLSDISDTNVSGSGTSTSSDLGYHASDEDRLLQYGQRLLDIQDWVQADRVLSRARDLRLDNAPVLASLAWARYHNPNYPVEERVEEARDLFLLAEQFDPRNGRVAFLHACFLLEGGDLVGATARAELAARLLPDDPEVADLLRRIRRIRRP